MYNYTGVCRGGTSGDASVGLVALNWRHGGKDVKFDLSLIDVNSN